MTHEEHNHEGHNHEGHNHEGHNHVDDSHVDDSHVDDSHVDDSHVDDSHVDDSHVDDSHAGHHHGLGVALWLTAAFMVVELVGGMMANSLALMADAGHMASDVMAIGIALVAQRIAARPAHTGMTYGYGRVKVLAAQVNGLTLWFLSGWIVWEAVGRFVHPPEVQGSLVLIIASVGLVVNLVIMRWLHGSHDLNTRAAYWHVVGDALGSVAAIIAGAVIMLTGWMPIDPILSILVAVILAWGGWRLVRETTLELMEAVPQHIDVDKVQQVMKQTEGVMGVHHIHIWRLPNSAYAVSAHVQVESMQGWVQILQALHTVLKAFEIEHVTLQPELGCCVQDKACYAALDSQVVVLASTITCPECKHSKKETMPTDACQWFYECESCHVILKPKQGDCCVFCSYGDVACPPIQQNQSCCD